jgi:hypothetical protein
MRVLFDQGVPVPLRKSFHGVEVVTAFEMGWAQVKNGDLIRLAEASGFSVLITTDKNLRYQQNLSSRCIAILVLGSTSWPKIRPQADLIASRAICLEQKDFVEFPVG